MAASGTVPRSRIWERLCIGAGLIEQLEVEESPVIAPGVIRLGQLTVLVGLHGSGKSYLLSVLASGLPGWQTKTNLPIDTDGHSAELSGRYNLRLRAGEVREKIDFSRPVDWRARRELDSELHPLVATRLNPFAALSELEFVSGNYFPGRLPEPRDLTRLKRVQLDTLRDITGHTYQWVEYGWIEDDHCLLPYVRGALGAQVVDTWTMSGSEFWVHFVLSHLKSANANEVVVIDEPETFLARPGHSAFIDEIARLTLASGCQTVVATHSSEMIRRVPVALLRQVTEGRVGATVSEVSRIGPILSALGCEVLATEVLVFVEDDLARRIVEACLRKFAPDQLGSFDVIDSGNDRAIRASLTADRSQRFRAVAVLDGDQRGLAGTEGRSSCPATTCRSLAYLVRSLRLSRKLLKPLAFRSQSCGSPSMLLASSPSACLRNDE